MKSIGTQIEELVERSAKEPDVFTVWEFDFINSIDDRTDGGKKTTHLSDKQVTVIEKIHLKHIGG